jgi:hypothetical protein
MTNETAMSPNSPLPGFVHKKFGEWVSISTCLQLIILPVASRPIKQAAFRELGVLAGRLAEPKLGLW